MRHLSWIIRSRPLLLASLILAPALAGARPLYAARTGMACARCHADPAGGGMRTGTGFRFAVDGHTMTPEEEIPVALDPRISEGLRLGGDLRGQYLQDAHNEVRARSSFFLMQASLSLAAELNERVSLVVANDQGRTTEAFALVRGLPLDGTIKVGRFRPAFGLEEEDHTTFTRDPLGFGNGSEETGVELSLARGPRYLTVAVMNGAPGATLFDDNAQKRVVGRAWCYTGRAGLGLSGSHNTPGALSGGGTRRASLYGAFGHLHMGPAVLLAEYDRGVMEGSDGPDVTMEAAFAELSYLLGQRFTAKLKLDRFDPDTDLAENASDRVSIGLESDLMPLVRLITFARARRDYGEDEDGTPKYGETRDTLELLAQLHVFF